MKRTFNRADVLMSVLAGAMLMLALGLLFVGPGKFYQALTVAFLLLTLVFWPDVEGGKGGGG